MKRYASVIGIIVLVLLATHVFAEYDEDAVQTAMQTTRQHMQTLLKASKDGNFFEAAVTLMDIAKIMKSLDEFTPPKGDKAEWDRIHGNIISLAFQGIGACGEKDGEKLTEYIGKINNLIKEGHGMFR